MISKIREIYNYRELLSVFVRKELKVKYKNSVLGFLWSFINPIVMAIVYTLIFSVVFPNPIKNFPIFLLIGLLPWNFFLLSLANCTNSIIANSNLITKVFFPREIIPLSIVLAALVDFMLEMTVIFVILLVLGYNFIPFLPLFILVVFLQVVLITGFSLFFSSLTVYFRDIQQLIGLLLTIWFFATPIVYDIGFVSNKSTLAAMALKIFNPMTSIVLLYRQALLHLGWPSINLLIYAFGGSFGVFFLGYFVFQKYSPNFAKEV